MPISYWIRFRLFNRCEAASLGLSDYEFLFEKVEYFDNSDCFISGKLIGFSYIEFFDFLSSYR